jgi:glucose-6-phosphate isomerase
LGKSTATISLRKAFDQDPSRSTRFARELKVGLEALFVDFSKQLITDEVIAAFIDVLEASGVTTRRDEMLAGVHVNTTEDRPASHTALRTPRGTKILVDGVDVVAQVHQVRDELSLFAERIASGEIRGATGKSFTHVLNIGIGGSDLGPSLLYDALATLRTPKLACSFISGMDTTNLVSQIEASDAHTTLVVICSKTFSTVETLANARLVQRWLATSLGEEAVGKHCLVVTAMPERAEQEGIRAAYSFPMWSWVGGRFSISSAVSAAVVVAFGGEVFAEFLDGMHTVDKHFAASPIADNLPMLLGLLDVWNASILHYATHAILPYSTALALLPNYLQQLEMESNGKHVTSDGLTVSIDTSPVVWGGVGTNSQHAFMELLHQGTQIVPTDFIAFAQPSHSNFDEHDALIANMFAQSQVMAFGRTISELEFENTDPKLVAHQEMLGNRPSTTIVGTRLTPATLGALIALYEHKVFVAGCVWGINSFDQWGVEVGKSLATEINAEFDIGAPKDIHDSSTMQLMKWYIEHRARS